MRKIVIFGNSGSGKSTLAQVLQQQGLAHLDLDTIAWDTSPVLKRKNILASKSMVDAFIAQHDAWVIEGCYADLIVLAMASSNEIIYMNLSVELCIQNAKNRPWEPHKYDSKAAQDRNLTMLIDWIKQYPHRADTCSQQMHDKLYLEYQGNKKKINQNPKT